MASAFASSSRLIRLRPSRFSSWVSTSVSHDPRSSRSRSSGRSDLATAAPHRSDLRILPSDCRWTVAADRGAAPVFFPRRASRMFSRMSALNPKRSSNSRIKSRPPLEVTLRRLDPAGEKQNQPFQFVLLSKPHEYWRLTRSYNQLRVQKGDVM